MKEKRRLYTAIGSLAGALYFFCGHFLPLPDFLEGLLMGATLVFLLLSLLPEDTLVKLEAWKRHG